MQPLKLDVLVAFFSFGGNGGVAMQLPAITTWFAATYNKMLNDQRIGRVSARQFGDIPLSMERNRVVKIAKEEGFDVIIMIDSDNVPDLYCGYRSEAKPFWDSSFEFLYERYTRGTPTVVCAPYCGPPPHPVKGGEENVYVFYAETNESDVDQPGIRYAAYSRTHAAQMRGIQEIAAGPTGIIMYTTSAFDLMPVHSMTQEEILIKHKKGEISTERAKQLINMESWFFYEYTDGYQASKASTEDVTNTREIQNAGLQLLKEPVVFCNWDAWAGHYKPKCVGAPHPIYMDQVSNIFREAVDRGTESTERLVEVDFSANQGDYDQNEQQEVEALTNEPEELKSVQEEFKVDNTTKWGQHRRIVGGRVTKTFGHATPDFELKKLGELTEIISQSGKPITCIEVGSWVGESAVALASGFKHKDSCVYCVDTFQGTETDITGPIAMDVGPDEIYRRFKENVGDLYGNKIRVIRGESKNTAAVMAPMEADLVFIDANHAEEEVDEDIRLWWSHVKNGGVLAGHDYCEAFPGVMKAVDEFAAITQLEPTVIEGTTIWFFNKR